MTRSVDDNQLLCYDVSPGVVAFSTKRGNLVTVDSPYSGFNANPFCGDDFTKVADAQNHLASMIGTGCDKLIIPHQVHGKEVLAIDEKFLSLDLMSRKARLDGIDALVTNLKDVCVCVSTADCVPVLILDRRRGVVAAVHAGWRGTVKNIVGETIRTMIATYGTRPEDCAAVIGPSISLDSFEVGDEVYDEFANAGFDMERIARRYPCATNNTQAKWHINLWEANRLQLLEAGVNNSNVMLANICTFINYDKFFSARRLTIKSGRMVSGIMRIKENE